MNHPGDLSFEDVPLMYSSDPVIDTMIRRRSIRKYLDREVPEDLLDQIIQAGLYAPSGGNHQYVRLFVLQGKERLERLNSELCRAFFERKPDSSDYQNKSVLRARKSGCHFLFHAPVLISAVSPRDHGNSMADSANALENIQIAAAALSLGACWVNQPHWLTDCTPIREVFEELGMSREEDIFGSVVLGYPAAKITSPPPRKEGRIVRDLQLD